MYLEMLLFSCLFFFIFSYENFKSFNKEHLITKRANFRYEKRKHLKSYNNCRKSFNVFCKCSWTDNGRWKSFCSRNAFVSHDLKINFKPKLWYLVSKHWTKQKYLSKENQSTYYYRLVITSANRYQPSEDKPRLVVYLIKREYWWCSVSFTCRCDSRLQLFQFLNFIVSNTEIDSVIHKHWMHQTMKDVCGGENENNEIWETEREYLALALVGAFP